MRSVARRTEPARPIEGWAGRKKGQRRIGERQLAGVKLRRRPSPSTTAWMLKADRRSRRLTCCPTRQCGKRWTWASAPTCWRPPRSCCDRGAGNFKRAKPTATASTETNRADLPPPIQPTTAPALSQATKSRQTTLVARHGNQHRNPPPRARGGQARRPLNLLGMFERSHHQGHGLGLRSFRLRKSPRSPKHTAKKEPNRSSHRCNGNSSNSMTRWPN